MQFEDGVTLKGAKVRDDGYLAADAFAVRTGIQQYLGAEVGRPDLALVNVYRPEAEVFSHDSLASFSHIPVTDDHPAVAVTAANWKDLAVGEVSTDVLRDGNRLRIPLIVKDAAVVAKIQNGKRELSAGYTCDLIFEDGVTEDGQAYQAKQVNIRANHLAVVNRGRAGPEFRIGDSWGVTPHSLTDEGVTPMNLKSLTVDGITIQVTDQGAEAIGKLQAQLADVAAKLSDAQSQLAAKDTEIGGLKVEVKTLSDAQPNGATLDKMVADRAELIDAAKTVAPALVTTGLSDAEIRRGAVAAKFGEDMVKDASDDAVKGMFAVATKDKSNPDPALRQISDARRQTTPPADNGQSAYEKRLQDAWKGNAA